MASDMCRLCSSTQTSEKEIIIQKSHFRDEMTFFALK